MELLESADLRLIQAMNLGLNFPHSDSSRTWYFLVQDNGALILYQGGVDNGMELILDLQQHEFMPVWSNNDELSIEAGFKVQIHDQSEPPFIHELGFGIAPGFQTLVAAQEQQVGFLPPPWGDCEGDANVEDHKYYQNYSISACRITCETKIVTQKCNCR